MTTLWDLLVDNDIALFAGLREVSSRMTILG
jgi:hypothetical protein